jgi:hypothetical protein
MAYALSIWESSSVITRCKRKHLIVFHASDPYNKRQGHPNRGPANIPFLVSNSRKYEFRASALQQYDPFVSGTVSRRGLTVSPFLASALALALDGARWMAAELDALGQRD